MLCKRFIVTCNRDADTMMQTCVFELNPDVAQMVVDTTTSQPLICAGCNATRLYNLFTCSAQRIVVWLCPLV